MHAAGMCCFDASVIVVELSLKDRIAGTIAVSARPACLCCSLGDGLFTSFHWLSKGDLQSCSICVFAFIIHSATGPDGPCVRCCFACSMFDSFWLNSLGKADVLLEESGLKLANRLDNAVLDV